MTILPPTTRYVLWLETPHNSNRSGFYSPDAYQQRTRKIEEAKKLTLTEARELASTEPECFTILEMIK